MTPKEILNLGFQHTYGGQYELGNIILSLGIDHTKVFIKNRFLMNIEFIEQLHTVFFAVEGRSLKMKN